MKKDWLRFAFWLGILIYIVCAIYYLGKFCGERYIRSRTTVAVSGMPQMIKDFKALETKQVEEIMKGYDRDMSGKPLNKGIVYEK